MEEIITERLVLRPFREADYDDLFEAVERVNPKEIHCTHGPTSFVGHLRAAGWNAFPLDRSKEKITQKTLNLSY